MTGSPRWRTTWFLAALAALLLACGAPGGGAELPGEAASAQAVLVPPGEPGEPLVVSGTVYREDGKTPVPGASLYVFHTDAKGLYNDNAEDNNERNPRLKGRLRTDGQGRYEYRTIKPGSYPIRTIPAHIHVFVEVEGYPQTVRELQFEGDPLISEGDRRNAYTDILPLRRGEDGVLRCTHDIRLAK